MKVNAIKKKQIEDLSREELVDLVKTLKKRKKYGLVWESKPENVISLCKSELPVLEEVKERAIEEAPDQPTNLIIEGDNYHALSVLSFTHAGKVDVIYIDPPYNTGARDWKYNNDYVDINDTFRHSKWLSMMHNRLLLAKKLLKSDGVLICAIDENEHAHLGVMLEEMFPNKELHSITVIHNPRGVQGKNFSYTHEYAYYVIPTGKNIIQEKKRKTYSKANLNLRDKGGESMRTDAKNCFYPFLIKDGQIIGLGEVPNNDFHPKAQTVKRDDDIYEVWPIDVKGLERKWRYARQSVEDILDILKPKKIDEGFEIEIYKEYEKYKTVWTEPEYNGSLHGTKLLREILPNCDFSFPKSLHLVRECLHAVIANNRNAIVLDYFAGSGTTGHAVMKLNEEDEGSRQFILVTNNENGIAEEVTYPRIKKSIEGYSDEKGIPSNLRYFKTVFIPKSEASDDTRKTLVRRSTEMICVRENAFTKKADNQEYKIFTNGKVATGILFDLDEVDVFKQRIDALKLPAHLYIFTLTDDVFSEDFEDLSVKHTLCPIPEAILEVYRKICD